MADNSPILIGRDNSANPGAQTLLRRDANSTSTDPVLTVRTPVGGDSIHGEASGNSTGVQGNSTSGFGVQGTSPSGVGVVGFSDTGIGMVGTSPGFGVRGFSSNIGVSGTSTSGVFGVGVEGSTDAGYGVVGTSTDGFGVVGGSSSGTGVVGSGTEVGVEGSSNSGVGVSGFSSSSAGVRGTSHAGAGTGMEGFSPSGLGVSGTSTSGFGVLGWSDTGIGVRGVSTSEELGFGVFAEGQVAGLFNGPVDVFGDLIVVNGNKPFKIDHPLDPPNKYLLHNAVEAPERKNVYDGLARLDEEGAAWVELPEWFEALNGDFRYQLTAVGGAMPNLHVAEEVSENRFKIAGGQEGMKVCWQLTGTRKDPWAAANPFEVEQEKPQEERGRYLEPGLYDAPEEQRVMMEPPRAEAVEEKQRPPEPSSIDFARLDPDSASLCTSTGFVYGSLEVPIVRQ